MLGWGERSAEQQPQNAAGFEQEGTRASGFSTTQAADGNSCSPGCPPGMERPAAMQDAFKKNTVPTGDPTSKNSLTRNRGLWDRFSSWGDGKKSNEEDVAGVQTERHQRETKEEKDVVSHSP